MITPPFLLDIGSIVDPTEQTMFHKIGILYHSVSRHPLNDSSALTTQILASQSVRISPILHDANSALTGPIAGYSCRQVLPNGCLFSQRKTPGVSRR